MSLEQALQDLTAAIREQTAAVVAANGSAPAAPAEPVKATKKVVKAEADEAPTKPAAKKAAAPAEDDADEAIPYADVQKQIIAVANAKGPEAARAVLKKFGVTKGQELKTEQYAEVIKAMKGALKAAAPAEDEEEDLA